MSTLLAFEDAPPYSVPLRFFLTAPFYGVAAALVWGFSGDLVLASRWSPSALVLTHLFTVGVLLQVMLGALFQFLPVAAGVRIPYSLRVSAVVHGLLNVGVIALCVGFFGLGSVWLCLGAGGVLSAAMVFFIVVGRALLPVAHTSPTIPSLKLALFGLLVTLSLGGVLVAGLMAWVAIPLVRITGLHATWGIIGWSLALIAGVSYVVVPMFQLTPPYRPSWGWRFAPVVIALLLVSSLVSSDNALSALLGSVLAGLSCAYAGLTLRLQSLRKRPVTDVTVLYWRFGMLLVFPAAVLWCGMLWGFSSIQYSELMLGILVFPGALWFVVSGMLYKIVPFLAWMHLQQRLLPMGQRVPHMGTFIDERWARRQFAVHVAAMLLLLLVMYWPSLRYLSSGVLGVSFALLGWNLWRAGWRYRQQVLASQSSVVRP